MSVCVVVRKKERGLTRLHVGFGVDAFPSCAGSYRAVFLFVAASPVRHGSLDGDHVGSNGVGLRITGFTSKLAGEVTASIAEQCGARQAEFTALVGGWADA
jgi:hypothetical protein